jgi:hypothetical protein
MYGAPFSSVPTSETRATCSSESAHVLLVAQHPGQKELERHSRIELKMRRRDHDAHAADPEHFLDAVLSSENLPLVDPYWRLLRGVALRRGPGRVGLARPRFRARVRKAGPVHIRSIRREGAKSFVFGSAGRSLATSRAGRLAKKRLVIPRTAHLLTRPKSIRCLKTWDARPSLQTLRRGGSIATNSDGGACEGCQEM